MQETPQDVLLKLSNSGWKVNYGDILHCEVSHLNILKEGVLSELKDQEGYSQESSPKQITNLSTNV